jgi:hypothetical protein
MKFVHLTAIIVILVSGYIVLDNFLPSEKDAILMMNDKVSPLIEELIQTKFFRIIRLNIK